MKLLEIISNAKLGKPNKGVLRVQKIENVGRALAFIKSKVHLENIGAEDIVDGNPTLILGLVWTIILRFQIEEIMLQIEAEKAGPKMSAKEALLLWCQHKTKGYEHVDVKDFSTSWRDGMAFGALLHSHEPSTIDMSQLKPEKPIENLTIAFRVANECFEIPQMLDPQDVNVPKPDERSIMTYVSSMYQILNKRRNKNKNAHRVGKTINQAIQLSSKINQYEVGVRNLLQWIRNKTAFFQQSTQHLPLTLEEVTKSLSDFIQYRRVEKSEKYEERTQLEALLFTISLLAKELRAKPYVVTDPQLKLTAISSAWQNLETAEHDYETAVRDAYLRLEKLERLVRRFENRAKLREEWLDEMEGLSERLQKLPGTQAGAARKAEALRVDIESKEKRFRDLDSMAAEIAKHTYYKRGGEIQQRNAAIQTRWGALSGPKMRALLARLAFPQTRADLLEQLEVITNNIQELEKQLTQPTKGELDAKRNNEDSITFEVFQAALDRHRLAEAEFLPLERRTFQIRNAIEKLWDNAPPMPNADQEKAGDLQKCQASIDLWNRVADQSRIRRSKLEAISSSYGISASLIQEMKWVTGKIDFLASTAAQTKDPKNARDLQLAQRLCKKHQALENEVMAHEPIWGDLKRSTEQFLNSRSTAGSLNEDQLGDTRDIIRRQLAGVVSSWNHLKQEMKNRQEALNECLESAQFYADADEASRWINEKIHLVKTAGILAHSLTEDRELDQAMKMCGPDSSSTMAQKKRLSNLETEIEAFQSNDLQRLKYFSTVLRKPMNNRVLKSELLDQGKADESSDIDSDNESSSDARKGASTLPKITEGRAQAVARYTARDPAGRDIDLEKGEIVAVIACTNADWWHIRRNVRSQRNEGYVPSNHLKLLEAPVTRRTSSTKDALKAVKREATRGLSIRRAPSARTSNQLHFDRENIQRCEKKVEDEFSNLLKCVEARDNCLQDTLAWHDFVMKSNNLETWMKQNSDQLLRDGRNMKNHGSSGLHIETTLEEISKGVPLLAEVNELADMLTGVIKPSDRFMYKRANGELYYKNLAKRRMEDIQAQWDDLNKQKTALEAKVGSSGSLEQFEKQAETLEILLCDRIAQLEGMSMTSPNADAINQLLHRVKAIKLEKPSLKEKISRLRTIGNNIMQTRPNDVPAINKRLRGIDQLWDRLQALLDKKEDAYSLAAAHSSIKGKIADLEGKLNDAEEQIGTLGPRGEISASQSIFQSLLPPDVLRQQLIKADDLDDDLNLYDVAASELCDQVRGLPQNSQERRKLCDAADGLVLRNEELKRALEGKKDNLDSAVKAQNLAKALGTIESNIKELDMRLQMTEPLATQTDVDREKRRVAGLKIELMKNSTAIGVNEQRVNDAGLPKDYADPLLGKCKALRAAVGEVMKKANDREAELQLVMAHVNFHDDAGDLDTWLDEKEAAVQAVRTPTDSAVGGNSPMDNLRQIRGWIKKLGAIDSELTANDKGYQRLKGSVKPSTRMFGRQKFP
uniref:SH3 domain-containing protein n=1 Tax=Mesocestoides corti TaxID=53468 RepID=A0A5K3EGH0_MESCO